MVWGDFIKPDLSYTVIPFVEQGKTDDIATRIPGPFGGNSLTVRRNWVDESSAQEFIDLTKSELAKKGISDFLKSATIEDFIPFQ